MRVLLLGTDFIYNSAGELIPIEINTNVGMNPTIIEDPDNIFNLTYLSSFITENNFTQVTYIGNLEYFNSKLSKFCFDSNISYEYHKVFGSITVPYIEDSEAHLIIRSSYDVTAIIDEEYCKNKINFLNLIKNSSFITEFAYKNDSGDLINNITSIEDNGNHPNFILKAVYPYYDKNEYPKLYKVSNIQELNKILLNVDENYFLMKYHYNPSKLCLNHICVIRTFNIIYPPNLQSISIGQYKRLSNRYIDDLSTFDENTFEINYDDRNKYLTSDQQTNKPKLLDGDQVEMSDDTFKYAVDLEVGDIVKTVKIYNPHDVNLKGDLTNYHITYEEFVSGSTYSSNEVLAKRRVDSIVDYVTIKFTDGTDWADTRNSCYLSLKNNEVRFLNFSSSILNSLSIGDEIILVDTNYDEFTTITKIISDIVHSKYIFTGFLITIKGEEVFLTKTEGESTQSYAAIEHNDTCGGYEMPYCFQGSCSVKFSSCIGVTSNPDCYCSQG